LWGGEDDDEYETGDNPEKVERQMSVIINSEATESMALVKTLAEIIQAVNVKDVAVVGSSVPRPQDLGDLSILLTSFDVSHPLTLIDVVIPPLFGSCYASWELPQELALRILDAELKPTFISGLLDILAASQTSDHRPNSGFQSEMFVGLYKSIKRSSQAVHLVVGCPQGCATTEVRKISRKRKIEDRVLGNELIASVAYAKRQLQHRVEVAALKTILAMTDYLMPEDSIADVVDALSCRLVVHNLSDNSSSSSPKEHPLGLSPTHYSDIDFASTLKIGTGVIYVPTSTEQFLVMMESPITGMRIVTVTAKDAESMAMTEVVPTCITEANDFVSKPFKGEVFVENWRLRNTMGHDRNVLDLGESLVEDRGITVLPDVVLPTSGYLPLLEVSTLEPIAFCGPSEIVA